MRAINVTKIIHDRYSDNEESEGVKTCPAVINAEAIRCFYPRNNNQPGTRITFIDGGGFAVTEDFATVKGMVQPS